MRVSDVRVEAIVYTVDASRIRAVRVDRDGRQHDYDLAPTMEILPRIDALREELRDTDMVAAGRLTELSSFVGTWGPRLLPEGLQDDLPDILVIVPHAFLHDLPFHLIRCGPAEEPLGVAVGVSSASSMTMFVRCAARNAARKRDLTKWSFDEHCERAPRGCPKPLTVLGVAVDALDGRHGRFVEIGKRIGRLFKGKRQIFDVEQNLGLGRLAAKSAFRTYPFDPSFDVVCLTAHGYVDPQDHRFSGILMLRSQSHVKWLMVPQPVGYFIYRDLPLRRFPASVTPIGPAEVLTLMELAASNGLASRLVVLLACSAGWARVMEGDQPVSLAESFLQLGAASVIAPLWDAEIDTVQAWTLHFFHALVVYGQPKALAARYAARKLYSAAESNEPERTGALALRGDWL